VELDIKVGRALAPARSPAVPALKEEPGVAHPLVQADHLDSVGVDDAQAARSLAARDAGVDGDASDGLYASRFR